MEIAHSTLLAICDVERFSYQDLNQYSHLVQRVFEVFQNALDLWSVLTGQPFHAQLDKCVVEGEGPIDILTLYPYLREVGASYFLGRRWEDVFPAFLQETEVLFAIGDLNQAISYPYDAAICCGRALDGLKKMIERISGRSGWDSFRLEIGVERSYIQPISDASREPRHGARYVIPENRQDILVRTWHIFCRAMLWLEAKRPLTEVGIAIIA